MEFIERFLRHVLLQGLRQIRRFGVWGNRGRTEKLTLLRGLLGRQAARAPGRSVADQRRERRSDEPLDLELLRLEAEQGTPRKCRDCGGNMGRDLPDAAPHGRPVDADAAEYGDAGGEWPGAAAPAALRLLVTTRRIERNPTACRDGFFSERVTSGATTALPSRSTPHAMTRKCHRRGSPSLEQPVTPCPQASACLSPPRRAADALLTALARPVTFSIIY